MSPARRVTKREQPPRPVRLIRARLAEILALDDPSVPGARIGDARAGVYAYYDFDGEPIYVGQTSSTFRDRVSRHLTGQRSDAVAKFILDPFEVAEIELWSIPEIAATNVGSAAKKKLLDPYEYTVYRSLEAGSHFHAVLNEGAIGTTALVDLPPSVRGRIIPDELWEDRQHADFRIARRASTIARLAQSISEREASPGMRRTLLLQARRLAWLAERRVQELGLQASTRTDELIDDG